MGNQSEAFVRIWGAIVAAVGQPRTKGLVRARNVLRGGVQRYGPEGLKKRLWDYEYSRGRWDGLDSMPYDCVHAHVERHANGGSILDLGCGPGATGAELASGSYSSYVGVDISAVAIAKAMKRAEDTGRAATNQYFCGDIFTYVPDGRYDVMLFGDSLYYVPWGQILTMLNKYSSHLRENGVFVARVYGRRYQPIIDTIQSHFQVVEKQSYVLPGDEIFVLAFRPRCLENEPS